MGLSQHNSASTSTDPGAATGSSDRGESAAEHKLVIGKIASPFGVQGWTKVMSYTSPITGLLDHPVWQLKNPNRQQTLEVEAGRVHGKFLVVKFAGIDDRDEVAELTNALVEISREKLPTPEQGSYYWADLIGLQVVTTNGVTLGAVESMLETGANDVMVVVGDKERLVPWIQPDVVQEVNLEAGSLVVDWDPDF